MYLLGGFGTVEIFILIVLFFVGRWLYRRYYGISSGTPRVRQVQDARAEAHAKGDAFEAYVERIVFPVSDYGLVHRTPSYFDAHRGFDDRALLPDLKFFCRRTNRTFWVEAKFRASLMEGKLEWCSYEQLLRYREASRHCPVFVAIGFGGSPSHPERLFVVPLDALQYTGVYLSIVADYEVPVNRKMKSKELFAM